jgi:hypothetical protein
MRAQVADSLGVPDRGEDMGRHDRPDELQHLGAFGGRVMTAVTDQRQQPHIVLVGQQGQSSRPARHSANEYEYHPAECAGSQSQTLADVLDVHCELVLARRLVAQLRQPSGRPPASTGGIHDEVSVQRLLASVRAVAHDARSGDPVPAG